MSVLARKGLIFFMLLCLAALLAGSALGAERRPDGRGPRQEEAKPAVDFNRMMREVEALRRFSSSEAEAALKEMSRDKQTLVSGIRLLKAEKASIEKDVVAMQAEYARQMARLAELEAIEREDMSSRKALEGAARLSAGTIRERLALAPYASLDPEMGATAARIMASGSFPSYEDIRAVTEVLFSELEHISRVSILPGMVTLPDGTHEEAEVLRVGSLLAAARTRSGEYMYLQPVDGGKRLLQVRAEIPSGDLKLAARAFEPGATAFPIDFSEGAVFKRFIGKKGFFEHIFAGGLLIWPIIGLGVAAFLFGLWRYARLLRVRFGNQDVLAEFFHLVRGNRLENAKALLEKNRRPNVPVYSVLSHMLVEWGGSGIVSMEKCRDEAIMRELTPLEKGVAFIAVAAAVAPLLGLLGTVTGMISTFDVITIFGNSDPKLLSGGISVALVTTELGLCVAIPLMFLHFVLSRRVASLTDDMEEKGTVLIARTSVGRGGQA